MRRKGIPIKVVQHFIHAIFDFYPGIDFIHAMAEKENIACHLFLKKMGFLIGAVERLSQKHEFFILTHMGLS